MKLNDFIAQMSKIFATVSMWKESDGFEEEMFVYFKDDDGSLRFVFLAMLGPIYYGSIKKALDLPFINDIGIVPTIDNDGEIIGRAHDMIVVLNEGIEDLDFDDNICCGCEGCCEEGCDKEGCGEGGCGCEEKKCEPKKKMWN